MTKTKTIRLSPREHQFFAGGFLSLLKNLKIAVALGLLVATLGTVLAVNTLLVRAADCDRNASNAATLNAEFAAATPGETICLASGDYGTWAGGSKAVTVTAAEDATPTMGIQFGTGASDFTLDGIGLYWGIVRDGAHDITVKNSAISWQIVFFNLEDSNILFDHNTHLNINQCGGCYGGRVYVGHDGGVESGVTIQNSLFRGGTSAGVMTLVGVTIRNNEFDGLDAIRLEYYAYGTHIVGNYIHDGDLGITAYNGLSHTLIEHNVIGTSGRATAIEIGSDDSSIIRHNTMIHRTGCGDGGNDCGQIAIGGGSGYDDGFGTIVEDNIATAIYVGTGATLAERTHNLVRFNSSGDDIEGVPVLYGSPNPTGYKGYASAGGSVSKNAASDGTDIGINLDEAFSDTDAPTISIVGPANGSTVSGVVTISAAAGDDTGIAGVWFEYDGQIIGSEDTVRPFAVQWNTNIIPSGEYVITAHVRDTAGKITASAPITLAVDNSAQMVAENIWDSSAIPANPDVNDTSAVELGVKFRSDLDGKVKGVRFHKSVNNTGTHVGSLWNTSGGLLATVTFTNETASGWQEALFDEPVDIEADTTYVVSYFTPTGHYASTVDYFVTQDAYSYPLRALQDGVDGQNGVFRYTPSSAYPADSYRSSNYWVDVVFEADDIFPPSVAITLPADGATVQGEIVVAAEVNDGGGVAGVQFRLDGVHMGAEDTTEPYQIGWDTTAVADGEYNLSAVARDVAGNTSSSQITILVKNTQDPDDDEDEQDPGPEVIVQGPPVWHGGLPVFRRSPSHRDNQQQPELEKDETTTEETVPEPAPAQHSPAREFIEKADDTTEAGSATALIVGVATGVGITVVAGAAYVRTRRKL